MLSFVDKFTSIFHTQVVSPAKTSIHHQSAQVQSPDFNILAEKGSWNGDPKFFETGYEISSKQLFKRPLVVAFFSAEWQEYGLEQLDKLHAVQQQIKLLGGHLLVITDAGVRELRSLVQKLDIKLNIYSDSENLIAEQFGVYDAENPVYNRISGIEKNVPLLATFVISPSRKIVFKHVNQLNNSEGLSIAKVLDAVHKAEKVN